MECASTHPTALRWKPQGTVLIKWTAYNQNGEAVYTFTPIGFVPCRPRTA